MEERDEEGGKVERIEAPEWSRTARRISLLTGVDSCWLGLLDDAEVVDVWG